jgi:hypothetical protein
MMMVNFFFFVNVLRSTNDCILFTLAMGGPSALCTLVLLPVSIDYFKVRCLKCSILIFYNTRVVTMSAMSIGLLGVSMFPV